MKVLFIGSSHTFMNDMPYMLTAIGAQNQRRMECTLLAHGGMSLAWHSSQPEVRFNITYGGYDYVVLQQLAHPFPGAESILMAAREINTYLTRAGSKMVAFMTWSEQNRPEHQQEMTDSYLKLAREFGALVVPAGLAWQEMRNRHPEVDLYFYDGQHASPTGSLLTALTFYRAIFDESPKTFNGEIACRNSVLHRFEPSVCQILMEAADAACLRVKAMLK